MAVLRVVSGQDVGQQIPLDRESAVLGRHPECDIVLEVGAVSRQHARITRNKGKFFVEDLKSRNGTLVNGQLISGVHPLHSNDEVQICDVVFTFHEGAPPDLGPPEGAEGTTSWATMVDTGEPTSNIMSKIDLTSTAGGLRVAVNPQVKLEALMEVTRNLAKSVKLEEVLPKILESMLKVFVQADRGFVVLQEGENGPLIPKAVKYRRDASDDTVRISRTVVRQVMESKEAILSADAATDPKFAMSESIADFRIRSLMCAPLVSSEGKSLGIIQIDTLDQRSRFQEDDLEVLASVALQAAFAVENAQLHEREVRQLALERDLRLAQSVQQGFLPDSPPDIPGYDAFHFYEPANEVGGDFFDYVPLPNNRLGVFVADVSGKGISAALLMAKAASEARYLLASEATPEAAICKLAAEFSGHGWDNRFITLVLWVIDLKTHEVTLVNAGHMPPLLRRADGTVEEVGEEITGVPVGVVPEWEYESCKFTLQPGDSLTAFTDGFSEATNAAGEMYGLEALRAQVEGPAEGVEELGARILDDVKKFVGDYRQSDDMCLLCMGREA